MIHKNTRIIYITHVLTHVIFYNSYSSIQLGSIGTFWSIRTFLIKKSYMKIQKSFLNYTNSSCTNFNQKCPNTPKWPDTPQFYTTDALFNKMFQYSPFVYYQPTFL